MIIEKNLPWKAILTTQWIHLGFGQKNTFTFQFDLRDTFVGGEVVSGANVVNISWKLTLSKNQAQLSDL